MTQSVPDSMLRLPGIRPDMVVLLRGCFLGSGAMILVGKLCMDKASELYCLIESSLSKLASLTKVFYLLGWSNELECSL